MTTNELQLTTLETTSGTGGTNGTNDGSLTKEEKPRGPPIHIALSWMCVDNIKLCWEYFCTDWGFFFAFLHIFVAIAIILEIVSVTSGYYNWEVQKFVDNTTFAKITTDCSWDHVAVEYEYIVLVEGETTQALIDSNLTNIPPNSEYYIPCYNASLYNDNIKLGDNNRGAYCRERINSYIDYSDPDQRLESDNYELVLSSSEQSTLESDGLAMFILSFLGLSMLGSTWVIYFICCPLQRPNLCAKCFFNWSYLSLFALGFCPLLAFAWWINSDSYNNCHNVKFYGRPHHDDTDYSKDSDLSLTMRMNIGGIVMFCVIFCWVGCQPIGGVECLEEFCEEG